MCLQAQQEMQLGRFEVVLKTVAPFLGGSSDLAPSRWALHLLSTRTGSMEILTRYAVTYLKTEQLAETGSDLLANVAIQFCKLCIASQLGLVSIEHL